MQVKKDGLVLQNPVTSENDKYNTLLRASNGMVGAVNKERDFSTVYHIREVKVERRGGKKYQESANDVKLQVIDSDQGAFEKHLFLRAKHTSAWFII